MSAGINEIENRVLNLGKAAGRCPGINAFTPGRTHRGLCVLESKASRIQGKYEALTRAQGCRRVSPLLGLYRSKGSPGPLRSVAKRDVRQRNQNSQNEPGISFGINATKKRRGRSRLNPNSVRPFQQLSCSLSTGYRYQRPNSRHPDCSYHIAGVRLSLHDFRRIRGSFSRERMSPEPVE